MSANWEDIKKCPMWKVLGVTECNNCDTKVKCWGKESVLPEPTNTRTRASLKNAFHINLEVKDGS